MLSLYTVLVYISIRFVCIRVGWTLRLLLFFFIYIAPTRTYTLSLHDALPISRSTACCHSPGSSPATGTRCARSEEHTSELQSLRQIVCRLLLEIKTHDTHAPSILTPPTPSTPSLSLSDQQSSPRISSFCASPS